MLLRKNTVRVFFSPSRRRAAKVVNHRPVALSLQSPATVELIEFPSYPGPVDVKGGRLGRSWFDAYRFGLRPSYARVGKLRLEATPLRIAPEDGSAPMTLSYDAGCFLSLIEAYELRSWPDGKLLVEIPRRDVFGSHVSQDPLYPEVSRDGWFVTSRNGRFIAEVPYLIPSSRKLRLIDVELAQDLPRAGFERAATRLDQPKHPFTPWALAFSEDERELRALFLRYTDRDFFENRKPDPARLAADDLRVCRWNTASGAQIDGVAGRESLLESFRRGLECPNIFKKPFRERIALHNWPGVKSSGHPGVMNWLFWKIARFRLERLSRQLERTMRDLSK
jgi:hypothetical protein